ncbi:hypothetical protein HAX54_001671, partial [Datura stramonium]|nr:hypothetical protein [Datura stramonium]
EEEGDGEVSEVGAALMCSIDGRRRGNNVVRLVLFDEDERRRERGRTVEREEGERKKEICGVGERKQWRMARREAPSYPAHWQARHDLIPAHGQARRGPSPARWQARGTASSVQWHTRRDTGDTTLEGVTRQGVTNG